MRSLRLFIPLFLFASAGNASAGGASLDYLDELDPYYVSRDFPRLITPQWVGESGVEAVVILAIDDMRGHEKWEQFLRPILERLKQIDGRAPVSIMTCDIDPAHPHLQQWLKEGLSLEVHTIDHPCPLLQKGDFAKAKSTYDRCVDLLASVPGNRPVAFRMPCCDSLNTLSPRFFSEIFNSTTPTGNFLAIDSSVFNLLTPDDPDLPRELVFDSKGVDRFARYLPSDRTFVNTIRDYPYPYVIGGRCWEFPCVVPSDWEAQHLQQPNNPLTLTDMRAALDAVVLKQGCYNLVFHPHGWIRNDQIVGLIDHAVAKHGGKVKFLTFFEAYQRLTKNLLAGQPLRDADGQDNGVRLLDLNADGYLDVAIGNEDLARTRVWSHATGAWHETDFPQPLVGTIAGDAKVDVGPASRAGLPNGTRPARLAGPTAVPGATGGQPSVPTARFGVLPGSKQVIMLSGEGDAWLFDGKADEGGAWVRDPRLTAGLEIEGQPLRVVHEGTDAGVRLRDLDRDGGSELIAGGPQAQAVFRWIESDKRWRKLDWTLPEGTAFVDAAGCDAGLRLVDVDEDGRDDIIFSDDASWSLHLFDSIDSGWSRKVFAGRRDGHVPADEGGTPPIVLPPFVVAGSNNGAWFHSRHLWVQNETTDRLPDLVDRRSFSDMVRDVEPRARTSQASLDSLVARPGFQVELMAAELLVQDPVAFAWGPDGKLWVVEMGDYPLGIDGKGKFGGRVRYLEDTDGDGKYDRSTVFLDGLGFPNGVMPWHNGVLVTCAPEILFAEDSDGDGRADVRRTLYRGFTEGNQQHRMNGLRMGLDNWVYGANGDSGGEIESVATGGRVGIGGRDFRIRPDQGLIDPETGQSQFLRDRDDWDNWFGSNNSNPMYHFVLADHYLRRNPHTGAPDARVNVSVAPGAAPVFPVSRTLDRFNDFNATNRFTSACSAIIYRDELFGPAFAGNSFVCEPVHNLVHREVLTPVGVTFSSQRAADELHSEFLASSDNWFRPTMVRTGPDGALWVADMYRQVIEHPEWIPADAQARLDLRAGHDRGRIYRVFPVGKKPRSIPRLDRLSTAGLVLALDSPSGWQRDMAQQLLIERHDPDSVPMLARLSATSDVRAVSRLHALCTLDGLGKLTADVIRPALEDPHPGVRRHAIRLAEGFLDGSASLAQAVSALKDDPDPQVRLQLAATLGEWHDPQSGDVLGQMALAAAGERFTTPAVMSSLGEHNLSRAIRVVLAGGGKKSPPTALVADLATLAAVTNNRPALVQTLQAALDPADGSYAAWQLAAVRGLLIGLGRRGVTATAFQEEAKGRLERACRGLPGIFAFARRIVTDNEADEPRRLLAVGLLGNDPGSEEAELEAMQALLSPRSSPALATAAVQALAAWDTDRVGRALVAAWSGYGPELRTQVLDAVFSRDAWLAELLSAIHDGRVPAGEMDASHRQRLLDHANESIRRQAAAVFLIESQSNRASVVARYEAALAQPGDPSRGVEVFKKICASCHRLGEIGHPLGPDLAALSDRSGPALLVAIFDPNRAVESKYINYSAITTDGRAHTGMMSVESGTSITLVAGEGKEVTLLRSEIEELASSSKSLMPEGVENDVTVEQVSDLLAWLGGIRPPRHVFAGNEPVPVHPESLRGEFWLLAQAAEVYGSTIVFEPRYRNFGFWGSADDHVAWSLVTPAAARYEVSLDYACAQETAGNMVTIEVGDQRVTAVIKSTQNWDTYRQTSIGHIDLPAGESRLIVRPEGAIKGYLMDLKAVRLQPAED